MRRRPQAELDALVAAAGFEKQVQRIDDHGIFTVSVARKPFVTAAEPVVVGRQAVPATG